MFRAQTNEVHMSEPALSTRRDARYALSEGSAFLSIPSDSREDPPAVAVLTTISLAGLGFRLAADRAELRVGAMIRGARVRIGSCEIEGQLAIREVRPAPSGAVQAGALFYPASQEGEGRLMAVISAFETAKKA
jgi:hypothetical protein